MNDFVFETNPWETYLESMAPGSVVSAASILAMMEGEDDDAVEDAFQLIAENGLYLDIMSLPKPALNGQIAARLEQEQIFARNGMNLREMNANDPLRMYLEDITSLPSFGNETQLVEEHVSGIIDHAEELTVLGLQRVIMLCCDYVGYGVLLPDLIQEGNIGLWNGIQSFTDGDYSAHINRCIRNAISKAVLLQYRSSGIGQKLRQTMQDYRSADEKLLAELGRNPSIEELANEIHISVEEAETIRKMIADALLLEQADKLREPDNDGAADDQAVEDTAYFQMRQRINELLSRLNETDAQILILRYGLENRPPMTPEEVGRRMNITAREVSDREAAAMLLLRESK